MSRLVKVRSGKAMGMLNRSSARMIVNITYQIIISLTQIKKFQVKDLPFFLIMIEMLVGYKKDTAFGTPGLRDVFVIHL